MSRTPVRSVPIPLLLYTIAAGRLTVMNCRVCREPLDIHQPNPAQPGQFLGTCPRCGCWYRIESRAGEDRAQVVQLPEVADVLPAGDAPPPTARP